MSEKKKRGYEICLEEKSNEGSVMVNSIYFQREKLKENAISSEKNSIEL